MKTSSIDCACGMKNCSTIVEIREDDENPKNLILAIKDEKHDLESWFSIDHNGAEQIVSAFKRKFKGL